MVFIFGHLIFISYEYFYSLRTFCHTIFYNKEQKKKKKSPDSLTIRALKKDSSLVQIHKHCLVGSNENQGLMLHTKKAQ